jgi:uncharacterized protein (DUF885 family)
MRALLFVLITALVSCGDNNAGNSNSQQNEANSLAAVKQVTARESQRFIQWLDEEYAEEVDFSPLLKTRQGDKSAHGELDDVSEAALDTRLEWRRASVAEMRSSFDRGQLDKQGQLSWVGSMGIHADRCAAQQTYSSPSLYLRSQWATVNTSKQPDQLSGCRRCK